jgi:hypothetical protein
MLSQAPQTKEQCEKEMAVYLADAPELKDKYRVEFCKDAGEWVVQLLEDNGNWLCLHNDGD